MILKCVAPIIRNIKCHSVNFGFIYQKDVKTKEKRVFLHIYLGHRYEVCPFNCLHIIAKAKFEDHKMKCRYKSDAQNA